MKNKMAACLCILLVMLWQLCMAETVTGDPAQTLRGATVSYQGHEYSLKKRVTTILVMGIDKWNDETEAESGTYRNGGQADFQALLIIDDNNKTIDILQINRDTMTDITVLNLLGQRIGTRNTQICLAYSYGDGAEESCVLVKEAIEGLLEYVSIVHYYSVNLDGIAVLNDLLGGVEVTLEDDFSVYDPAMTEGRTIRLQGKQAEYYLRNRYYVGDGSNAARMIRQQQYLKAAEGIFREKITSSAFVNQVFEMLGEYAVTDMTRGYIVNLANKAEKYTVNEIRQLEGDTVTGSSGYVEFHADEQALTELVLELFYIQCN